MPTEKNDAGGGEDEGAGSGPRPDQQSNFGPGTLKTIQTDLQYLQYLRKKVLTLGLFLLKRRIVNFSSSHSLSFSCQVFTYTSYLFAAGKYLI